MQSKLALVISSFLLVAMSAESVAQSKMSSRHQGQGQYTAPPAGVGGTPPPVVVVPPANMGAISVTCAPASGTCTVTGVVPTGASGVSVSGVETGGGSVSGNVSGLNPGDAFSLAIVTGPGNWTFSAYGMAADGITTSVVAATANFSFSSVAALLNDPSTPIASVADLSGLSNNIISALSTSSCGVNGSGSCLAAFNAQRPSSNCTLQGGASATVSQMDSYVTCVMVESYTSAATGVALAALSQSASTGCGGSSINVPKPSMCGYSAWTCPVTNLPAGWINHSTYIEVPNNASSNNVSLQVEMRLADWSNSLIKTVSQPVSVVAAVQGASNGYKLFNTGSQWQVREAFDSCRGLGGDLATLSEAVNSGLLPNGVSHYFGQKVGQTTRPVFSLWAAHIPVEEGSNYKAAVDNGTQKYVLRDTRNGDTYACTDTNRNNCTGATSDTKYYVCKNLTSCP